MEPSAERTSELRMWQGCLLWQLAAEAALYGRDFNPFRTQSHEVAEETPCRKNREGPRERLNVP